MSIVYQCSTYENHGDGSIEMQKRDFAFLLALYFSPVAAYADDFSDLFCGHKCQLRKQQEQTQADQEEIQEIENERQQRMAEQLAAQKKRRSTPVYQALIHSITVADFLAEGGDIDGKIVYVNGVANCKNLTSCNIHYLEDNSKDVWFDPSQLSLENRKKLLSSTRPLCPVILRAEVKKVNVIDDGEEVTEEGIIATEPSYIDVTILPNLY
ncbi:hypothetical protein [Komagataeibacter oboediens]